MSIINATPHAVNIYGMESVKFDAKQRKYFLVDGMSPIHTIPPSGALLSARMEHLPSGSIDEIPVQRSAVVSADTLPEGDDFYVVSRLFHSAILALGEPTNRLLLIGSPVYKITQDGAFAPCGCLALERG